MISVLGNKPAWDSHLIDGMRVHVEYTIKELSIQMISLAADAATGMSPPPATETAPGNRRPLEITKVRGSQVRRTAVDVQLAVSDSRPSGS